MFTAPAMLGWLAAAIIPLVLLWWYRTRRMEMKFAAMQFLERAIAREGRRRSWLQWLVVALQVLVTVITGGLSGNDVLRLVFAVAGALGIGIAPATSDNGLSVPVGRDSYQLAA